MDHGDKLMARVSLVAFGGTGLLILLLAISSILEQRDFLARAPRAAARVLRVEQRTTVTGSGSKRQRSVSDCAVLEFETAAGEIRQADYCYGLLEASFEPGDAALVHYDPDDPARVLVDGFGALWLGYVVMLGMGLVFMAAGAFTHWMVSPA